MTQPTPETTTQAAKAYNPPPLPALQIIRPKNAFLTTEFWKSATFNAVALLTVVGDIQPTGNSKYDSWIRVAAVLSAAINNVGYFKSRAEVKGQAEATARAVVVNRVPYSY